MNVPGSYAFTMPALRALMATIQPITGDRASGLVTLQATAGTVNVRRGSYMFPALGSPPRVVPSMLFKVAANPATSDGSWPVTTAPTDVGVISNLGGTRHNVPAGTPMYFDPPLANIVASPTAGMPLVATGGMTGGLDLVAFGALKDVVLYESSEGPAINVVLERSALRGFPGALLTWMSTETADGSSTDMTKRSIRAGVKSQLFKVMVDIMIITNRSDSEHHRRAEGLAAMDAVFSLISDRMMVDGESLSTPGGAQVLKAFREDGPQEIFQKFYVYHLQVAAVTSVEGIDARTFSPWLLTTLTVDPVMPRPTPQDPPVVNDVEIDMT